MIKKILLVLLLLVVVAGAAVFFLGESALNNGLRKVVVDYGPGITGTPVALETVQISPFNGTGRLTGFVIGNPAGFTTEKAMSVGQMEVSLVPSSILGETIEINRILIDAPEIIVERAQGTTNLQAIQKHIESVTGGSEETAPPTEPGKKISIGEFVLSNARVSVSALGQVQNLTIPTITLRDLGTAEGGVPPAEIARAVMQAVMKEVAGQLQQVGLNFLKDPQGNLDAARQKLEDLKKMGSGSNLQLQEAGSALKSLFGGEKKEKPEGGGE